ncbi:Peptidyl-prolyl cis-trans isomerase cyclophilin-type [Neofusicoccum parvum]|uniref:Peptidyl-prolyl cis-trans isomerase cyclophilin-type n=1 Tax=Neofusicoccum parvum TaxID=310453 RepID=A0ACB5S0Y9_9PEZI|nr:Peptidyl-prolyl cis-trans isomerase cyclophilin-type [Neofusicoccum parvum]
MGKGTDKLYITHSEWASEDAYSASFGSGVNRSKAVGASFRRLPFNFCALSLLPFEHPVCTAQGTIFDLTNIVPWLKKHGTNPVDGQPLKSADLIKLNFAKNDDAEYVDPVTYKVFTDNTHLVALKTTGNVFAWDTIERLNIKAKNWRDLVSDEEFSRKDIITLQDPQNLESRDLSAFKYIKDGESNLTEEQEKERASGVNAGALGSSAKVLKAKDAVAKARADREKAAKAKANGGVAAALARARADQSDGSNALHQNKPLPYNAAQYTTGKAAASFTSTGVTPHTSNERALLSDEEYMLKRGRVKIAGYARMQTSLGELNVELHTEFAPKAVWNFVQLAKKGYYRNISFHRNIRNFMIQGGDPTGTGRGGQSIWGKNFNDEFEGPNKHDARGILSMANKGKNTNSSQFFITYRAAKHLDNKHTIFGRVVGGMDALSRLENAPTDSKDRPDPPVMLEDVVVFVDPFEEFQKQKSEKDAKEREQEEIKKAGGTEDDKTTWTGKRIRGDGSIESGSSAGGVGKYLQAALAEQKASAPEEDGIVGEWGEAEEPVRKKFKAGGFGNFDNW